LAVDEARWLNNGQPSFLAFLIEAFEVEAGEHVGLVVSGTATAALEDGRVFKLRAGELFYIPPVPHDSWVGGDEPYVSLHFLGADHYAK